QMRQASEHPGNIQRRDEEAIKPGPRWRDRCPALFFPMLLVFMLGIDRLLNVVPEQHHALIVVPSFFVLAGWLVCLWYIIADPRSFGRIPIGARVDLMLRHTLCPDCGSSIKNIPAAPDGCTVCPKCAAAWKMPTRAAENAA